MFNLDEEISNWCLNVAEGSNISRSEIEELRDHLATEVQRQQSLGADDEKAFALATAQIGNIGDLAGEYSKNRKFGLAIRAVAKMPHAEKVLGVWLLAIACLMSFTHIATFFELFVIDGERPADFADLSISGFLGLSLLLWAPFVWGGFAGAALLRGRELGPGRLLGLAALIAIQIPVFGAQPLPAFELSGGLQLTVLLGSGQGLLDYQTLPDIHINAPAGQPHYFGISLLALTAFVYTAAKFLDCVQRNEARIRVTEALG